MKTNHSARQIVRIRSAMSLMAVLAILVVELGLGASMVSRLGQTSSPRTRPQAESMNVSIGDLVAVAR
jgi:hypothetical protein